MTDAETLIAKLRERIAHLEEALRAYNPRHIALSNSFPIQPKNQNE